MGGLEEIVKRRLNPGILIFDMDNRLSYANKEALDILSALKGGKTQNTNKPHIPREIYALCDLVKGSLAKKQDTRASCSIMEDGSGSSCSLRAFLLGAGDNNNPSHIMVLIERIVEKRGVDFEKAKRDFNLSKRESEVLTLLCNGDTNKAIAEKLFISEYTVKDHIKNIMDKTGAKSRSEIIALIR